MSIERLLHPAYLSFILLFAIASPVIVYTGYVELAKYVVCILFLGGAVCSLAGYLRYASGPRVPALLLLLVDKNVLFSYLGIGFLVSAVTQAPNPVTINFAVLLLYSSFGATGAAMFFSGVYVLLGAGRGWILREVYKNPFRRRR